MRKGLLLFACFVLWSVPTFAQRSTGTIRGVVTDASGAVVAGAKVTVKGESTGYTRSANTNASGLYTFDLPVGTYTVTAELTGFKSSVVTGIALSVADTRPVDLQLSTGDVAELITVEANALAVKTIGGDVSGLITGEQVRELPLNGRNFLQLATLMPGVSAPDFLNVKDKGLLGGSDLSISGSAVTANLWTVDGANNNDVGSNRTILVYPSVDAIEEFKVQRNSYGAEFGQAGGAQINIVTRGGTNEFHGNLFYAGRRDSLNSKSYFLEQAGKDKEKLKRNDFGWTFGGPIVKDKLHFFASQEWNRELRGTVRTAFVPTAAERAGDFSGPSIPGCTLPAPVDPLTGQPFPGNKIPADRLSRGGGLYLQLYSLPNTTPQAGSCNNWVDSLNSPINWRQENVRFDYTLGNSTRVMVRYTQDSWTNKSPNVNTNLWGDDSFPAVDSDWDQPGRSFIAQLNQNIGSKGVNSLTFSYSANKITITRGGTNPGLNSQITSAIPSIFPLSDHQYGQDIGHPVFWGGGGYPTLWNEAPFLNNQNLYILKDDYSAVFGKHFVKAGVLGSYNEKNEDSNGNGSAQNSAFWGSTGLNGWGGTTGNLLADFLLKDMAFGFSESVGERPVPQRWKDLEFYVQDSWKVLPRVTIDYGVRYSKLFNYYSSDDKTASFDPALFNAALGGDPCNGLVVPPGTNPCSQAGFKGGTTGPNRSLQKEDNGMIAPRVGLAWDVSGTGKTAVRAGLGLFYLRERLSGGLAFATNPPYAKTQSGTRTLDSNQQPCDGCFSLGAGSPGSGRDPNGVTPNNWQWNVSVQHELLRNTTIELGYVGSKGNDLLQLYDADQVRRGDLNGNGIQDRLDYARTTPALAAVRPYGNAFGDRQIIIWGHGGSSTYHSLQTQLISRFGRGSQFQASYTWSRSKGDVPLTDSGGISADQSITDLDNRGLDQGRTLADRTHIFNASLVLMLPSLASKTGFVKNVFGDWEVAGIVQASTGSALSVYTGTIPGLNGGPSGTGYNGNQRPNLVPGVSCNDTSGSNKEQILNPAAFTLTGFEIGTVGNATRGVCNGPGLFQVDLSLYKNIKISERVKVQLRFEVFNIFNRVNFLGNNLNNTMNPTSATFDTGDPATATTITGYTLPGNFGQAVGTRDPRQAQVGVKLIF
jgi:hypothetical protein